MPNLIDAIIEGITRLKGGASPVVADAQTVQPYVSNRIDRVSGGWDVSPARVSTPRELSTVGTGVGISLPTPQTQGNSANLQRAPWLTGSLLAGLTSGNPNAAGGSSFASRAYTPSPQPVFTNPVAPPPAAPAPPQLVFNASPQPAPAPSAPSYSTGGGSTPDGGYVPSIDLGGGYSGNVGGGFTFAF